MNRVFSRLARQQSSLFKVNYALEYKTFTPKYVVSDPTHPLHETQKRRSRERKKEGLWWHATTGVDLSKSSCVRAWARRRLRNAITEELSTRGYDENGKYIKSQTSQDKAMQGQSLDLKGSLRLHVQAPLISAKFTDVKAEAGKIIEIMMEATRVDTSDQGPGKKVSGRGSRPSWNPPSQARKERL